MDKFWELLEKSTIISGVVTVGLVGTCIYLWVVQQPVPDLLATALTLVLGYFFGAKATKAGADRQAYRQAYKDPGPRMAAPID